MKSQYFKVIIFAQIGIRSQYYPNQNPNKCFSRFAKWFYDFYEYSMTNNNQDIPDENNKVRDLFCQMS